MSYTKFVMDAGGHFVLHSKYSGLDHGQIALLLEGEPVSAGFIYVRDGLVEAYGESMTLELSAHPRDTEIIRAALVGQAVGTYWDDICDRWFATNQDNKMLGERHGPETLESLIEKKVLEL